MSSRKLLVTHHSPDLDAVGAVWMLKRFDSQHYANAQVAFVDSGNTIELEEAEKKGYQLHEVTHVDTGLGEFDHHQPERGQQHISATSLTYDHVCEIHPEYKQDKALAAVAAFVTDIDHFGEVYWPESGEIRHNFMIQELLRGYEFTDPHNDDAQLHFGMQCLDNAYASLKQYQAALDSIEEKGMTFESAFGKSLAIETRNDTVIKLAQKQGHMLVIRKDPKLGNARIKLRPDCDRDLKTLEEKIKQVDTKGTWYYHPSGKMLLNGSTKRKDQTPTPLPLAEIVALIKEIQ